MKTDNCTQATAWPP